MRAIRRGSIDEGLPVSLGPPVPLSFTFRDPDLKEKYRVGLNRIAAQEVPIEIKLVNPPTLSQLQRMEPKQMFWVRARGYIGKRTHGLEENTLQGSRPAIYLPCVALGMFLPVSGLDSLSA